MANTTKGSVLTRRLTTSLEYSGARLSTNTEIDVYKISTCSAIPKHEICHNQDELHEALRGQEGQPWTPVISLHCKKTLTPLCVTSEDLLYLLRSYNIDPDFVNAISAFGDRPNPANGGCHGDASSTVLNGSFSCWFRLQYMELNGREGGINPWSIRHTAIYHNIQQDGRQFIILVNPCKNSTFEKRLQNLRLDMLYEQEMISESSYHAPVTVLPRGVQYGPAIRPVILLLLLLLETYLDNWQAYKNERWRAYERVNDRLATSELASPAFAETLETLQLLRGQQDKAMIAGTFCQGNLRVVKVAYEHFARITLKSAALEQIKHRFDDVQRRIEGHESGFRLLQTRISNSIELLNYTVDYQNQNAASLLNESLLNMTKNTVDDSATIKVITIVSLFFLPGSFVASIYGMDFFNFEQSHGIIIGRNFWLFLVTWLPLTFLTIGIYLVVVATRHKVKTKSTTDARACSKKDKSIPISNGTIVTSVWESLTKLHQRTRSKPGAADTLAEKSV